MSSLEGLDALLKTIKHLSSNFSSFDKVHFLESVTNKMPLPLELIWLLHKNAIIPLELFIQANLGNGVIYKRLIKDLLSLLVGDFNKDKEKLSKCMITDLLSFLILNAFSEEEPSKSSSQDKPLQEATQLLLGAIFEGVYDHSRIHIQDHLFLQTSWLKGNVLDASFKKFTRTQLMKFVSYKPKWTVTDAFTKQGEWSYAKTSDLTRRLFQELTHELKPQEMLVILKRILEEEEVNWKIALSFSSYLMVTSTDITPIFKELLEYFLQEAFESFEQEGLISAFLLARQATNEGTHVFMSYEDWFQGSFCRSNHPFFSSKKEVTFFLSFLTNLVPLESAQFLKVHVQHSSFIPAKYNVLLDDYITLAKTRLTDLKVPWDSTGIFKQKSSETDTRVKDETKNPAEADVHRAVDAFEKTGKIPSTVLQAIMFRRKYFHSYFLPTLLAPRMLPDIPDSKMKFIMALNQANKIPSEKFLEYEQRCGEMLNELLEAAFSEEVMEDILEPLDALKADISKLAVIIAKGDCPDDLRRHLSVMADSLKMMLRSTEGETYQSVVDLEQVVIDKQLTEIVDVLLGSFSEEASDGDTARGQRPHHWLDSFVTMLSGHPALHVALFKRLWRVHRDNHSNAISMVRFGSLFAYLHYHRGLFPKVKVPQITGQHTLLELVSELHLCSTADEMASSLRFLFGAIEGFITMRDCSNFTVVDMIPSAVVQRLCYLIGRFKSCSGWKRTQLIKDGEFSKVLTLFNSTSFGAMVESKGKLNIHQWAMWELEVTPHLDLLSDAERHNYHHLVMFSEFLPQLKETTDNIYWSAGRIILNAILDLNKKQYLDTTPNKLDIKLTSQRDLVLLVSELLSAMPPQANTRSNKVFLLGLIEERCGDLRASLNAESVTSATEREMESFIRILLCLPPTFVISNHHSQPPSEHLLEHLAQFLENHRHDLMDEPTFLPFLITVHIFKAFLMVLDSISSLDTMLGRIFHLSPLLQISFMVHWSKMKAFVMEDTWRSKVIKDFHVVQEWVKDPKSQLLSLSSTLDHNLLQSSAVFANIYQNSTNLLEEFLEFFRHNSDTQVSQTFAEFLVSQSAWHILHQTEHNIYITMLVAILQLDSTILLQVFSDNSSLKDKVLHPSSVSLFPVVFFRIFEEYRGSDWLKCLPSESFLATAIKCHINQKKLYLDSDLFLLQSQRETSQAVEVGMLLASFYIISCQIAIYTVRSKNTSPYSAEPSKSHKEHLPQELLFGENGTFPNGKSHNQSHDKLTRGPMLNTALDVCIDGFQVGDVSGLGGSLDSSLLGEITSWGVSAWGVSRRNCSSLGLGHRRGSLPDPNIELKWEFIVQFHHNRKLYRCQILVQDEIKFCLHWYSSG
ncbi:putative Fanconi anemia group A protein [Apostichopus japonicus]|uniref:Putative Fanconi anemia group A protein n=1 Tax=Stichopus japonicus TaxID=307972 RepID=A0A2G8K907_STIJA|nr:putative Fanconi anemia group A protein [Apostichopus japonicus]